MKTQKDLIDFFNGVDTKNSSITPEQKAFLQSIGRYHPSITQQEMNEITNAFSGNLAGHDVRIGYYGGMASMANSKQLPRVQAATPLKSGIKYVKMSLFDAPNGSVLVHACNAQGVWGSGIAKEFKSVFPKAFDEYNNYCNMNLPYHSVGTTLITKPENSYRVGCLITSSDFGARLNAEQLILTHTKHALDKLGEMCNDNTIYSNKFNSGFFKVPWEKTEKLINDFVKKYNRVWVICDPDLQEKK